jgi:hypothetical protein
MLAQAEGIELVPGNDLGRAFVCVGDTCYIGSDRVAVLKLHYPAIALAASNIAPSGCGIFWEP